jgi:hypothetical protein
MPHGVVRPVCDAGPYASRLVALAQSSLDNGPLGFGHGLEPRPEIVEDRHEPTGTCFALRG